MEYDIESILEKYEDDYNPGPRPMAQEPRNMYNQGQLVSNTVDGSRPGYAGDETFLVKVGKPLKVKNVIESTIVWINNFKIVKLYNEKKHISNNSIFNFFY